MANNTNARLNSHICYQKKNNEIPPKLRWKCIYHNRKKNLKGKASWTPIENTYFHFLTFDLGDTRTINKIATLGRPHTNEFVTEYVVQYSDDGELWRSYVSPGGEVQVTNVLITCFVFRSPSPR